MSLVVGIDLATATVRAVAADGEGRVLADSAIDLPPPYSPRPGWVEQDATAWWPAVTDALLGLADRLGRAVQSVVAVSVCATSGTVVTLDRRGRVLGPALMYADQRATNEAESAQVAAASRWAALGLWVQPSFGLAKWGWLVRHRGLAEGTARLAHASDAVLARMVGELVPTDWSSALKSGYDPLAGEWADEALASLHIPERLLPDVVAPTTAVGHVSAQAAAATGLPLGCQVRAGPRAQPGHLSGSVPEPRGHGQCDPAS